MILRLLDKSYKLLEIAIKSCSRIVETRLLSFFLIDELASELPACGSNSAKFLAINSSTCPIYHIVPCSTSFSRVLSQSSTSLPLFLSNSLIISLYTCIYPIIGIPQSFMTKELMPYLLYSLHYNLFVCIATNVFLD